MAKKGLILMNLGSPDSTEVKDVKKYLDEFLMDERVIDKPYLLRWLLVKVLITPSRSPKSAEAYKEIWWDEGSPLVVITERQKEALSKKIDLPIAISMRYGNPTPRAAYDSLLAQNPDLEEVILFPLYPHYAMSSYETAVEHMKAAKEELGYKFKLKVVPPFYEHPAYIDALVESIKPALKEPFDQLLFSYHGIPERHLAKADPSGSHPMFVTNCCTEKDESHHTCYRYQVTKTTELVTKALGLTQDQYSLSYQSRLGRDPWLTPSTQTVVPEMPKNGIKKLKVVCPAFVSDCLETLEEINMRAKEEFLALGGERFEYIPCMNEQDAWINAMVKLVDTAV
jgi:ferrochelatase